MSRIHRYTTPTPYLPSTIWKQWHMIKTIAINTHWQPLTLTPIFDCCLWWMLAIRTIDTMTPQDGLVKPGYGLKKKSMLKCMLVNRDYQTWLLIGWQHQEPCDVRKYLLTYMAFNIDFLCYPNTSRMGVTKPNSSVPLFSQFFIIVATHFNC